MTSPRRGLAASLACLAALATTVVGCSSEGSPTEDALTDWLAGLDGVSRAAVVTPTAADLAANPYGRDEPYLTVGVEDDATDADVEALVETVRTGWADHACCDLDSSIELEVGPFAARFYPSTSALPDLDLERALWLRRDGRATGSTYRASDDQVVVAPASDVAGVALGFDAAAEPTGGRRTERVESPDRDVVVEWGEAPGLGWRLPRDTVQAFADLVAAKPGTTGYVRAPEDAAAFWLSPDDVDLATVLADPAAQVPAVSGPVELGWGPARAPVEAFAATWSTSANRDALERLLTVPDVVQATATDGGPRSFRVTVRTAAGYAAAARALRDDPDYVPIDVVRESSPSVGRQGDPVLTGSNVDDAARRAAYVAIGGVAGVRQVKLGPGYAQLVVATDVTDADLDAALTGLTALAPVTSALLLAADGPVQTRVGQIRSGTFVPATPTTVAAADPALVARVGEAWASVTTP